MSFDALIFQIPSIITPGQNAIDLFDRDLADFTRVEVTIDRVEAHAVGVAMAIGIDLREGIGASVGGERIGDREAIFSVGRNQVGMAGSQCRVQRVNANDFPKNHTFNRATTL